MTSRYWGYALIGVGLAFGIEALYTLIRSGFRWQEAAILGGGALLAARGFHRVMALRNRSDS